MKSIEMKIVVLLFVILSLVNSSQQDDDQPDTPVTEPKCREPKSKWTGWSCVCPDETPYFDESSKKCLECTGGRSWNTIYELCMCPSEDQDFNEELNTCECSGSRMFNSTSETCDCTFGRQWNSISEECECPYNDQAWNPVENLCECKGGQKWNSITEKCECQGEGREWDYLSMKCVCTDGRNFNENTEQCVCMNGKVWISDMKECICPSSFQWNGTYCVAKEKPCEIGKEWNGVECVPYCQKYEQLDGGLCTVKCHRNEVWDDLRRICIPDCGLGEIYDYDYNKCHENCKESYIWNDDTEQCTFECNDQQIFVNGECVCREGFYYNGNECTEVEMYCPEGWKLGNNKKCYQITSIRCPFEYTEENGICVKKEMYSAKCPPGYIYNEFQNLCFASLNPECHPGSELIGGKCVESVTIRPGCPEGYDYYLKKCIKVQESSCPDGYEKKDGICVMKKTCKESQQLKDGICIEIKCPPGYNLNNKICELPREEHCTEGFVLEQGKCVRKFDEECREGLILIDGVCRRNIDESCPNGYILVDGKCNRILNDECPVGFRLDGNICKRIIESNCGEGFTLSGNVCKPLTVEDCPANFALVEGKCKRIVDPNCPEGLTLSNGVCTREIVDSCPKGYILEGDVCKPNIVGSENCPDNLIFFNGGCIKECPKHYRIDEGKCVFVGSESITSPCDHDEIIVDGKCFKLSCPDGFKYVENRCIEISCPDGYEWLVDRCRASKETERGAVFEINNYIFNHLKSNSNEASVIPIDNKNSVNVYVDGNNNECDGPECVEEVNCEDDNDCSIDVPLVDETSVTPTSLIQTTSSTLSCCRVITPRMCKKYDTKWLCYNKNFHDCNEFCTKSVVYLKPPQTIYKPPVLIVPPNPPLESCKSENCHEGTIDCSGCAEYKTETCSPYCYDYHCINGDCTYYNQEDFCRKYPFSVGCSYNFGCIGDWCYGEKNQFRLTQQTI